MGLHQSINYRVQDTAVVGDNGERYQFLTKEVAQKFLQILQNDANVYWLNCSVTTQRVYAFTSSSAVNVSTYWTLQGHQVVVLDHEGRVVKFDLPWMAWCWLRTSGLAKMLMALWYGQRRK